MRVGAGQQQRTNPYLMGATGHDKRSVAAAVTASPSSPTSGQLSPRAVGTGPSAEEEDAGLLLPLLLWVLLM